MRFTDNVLVDLAGPDLYVFEVGPAIEPMRLAISQDGTTWTEVGDISGGTAAIDIAKVAKPGERYRFVRVTDLKRGMQRAVSRRGRRCHRRHRVGAAVVVRCVGAVRLRSIRSKAGGAGGAHRRSDQRSRCMRTRR